MSTSILILALAILAHALVHARSVRERPSGPTPKITSTPRGARTPRPRSCRTCGRDITGKRGGRSVCFQCRQYDADHEAHKAHEPVRVDDGVHAGWAMCDCGCGRELTGRQVRWAGNDCRMRASRRAKRAQRKARKLETQRAEVQEHGPFARERKRTKVVRSPKPRR